MERTLVILKPECIENCIVSSVLKFFDELGLRSVEMRQLTATESQLRLHYKEVIERYGPEIGNDIVSRMKRGPIIAIIYEGCGVIQSIRNIIGATDPQKALPGTIRNTLGTSIKYNIIHASDSTESARTEISIWFPSTVVAEHHIQPFEDCGYITGC